MSLAWIGCAYIYTIAMRLIIISLYQQDAKKKVGR